MMPGYITWASICMENDTSSPSRRAASDASPAVSLRDRASGVIAFAMILALLYFGRDVLIPFTLALVLSLLLAPLVRALKRLGLGQAPAVLLAVLALALAVSATAVVLGTQVLRMAASLPQYQETIQQKLQNLDELTVGKLNTLTSEASGLIERHSAATAASPRGGEQTALGAGANPIPVELHDPRPDPFQIIERVLASVWAPVETAGIVLVVLIFVLLEYETLRDRFIRIAGGANLRMTTLALNDAGERLSKFFVSQFAVNLGVGVAIGVGLALLGLPHAMLWAALAAVLRFVPYVGVWIAAVFSATLAVAVVPGWSLAISTLGLFVLVEIIAGQVVEPQLYGHTTGLSPLSVVVAAIFWSALWGPIGLILSTPLTLCVLVAGRHIKALYFLDLLLADTRALSLSENFYQRALSGDAHEVSLVARKYLKLNSLAAYCDQVLMPAMHLGLLDHEIGAISEEQQLRMRKVMVTVVSNLCGESLGNSRRRRRNSVLEQSNSGQMLRQQRERLTGKWQGPLVVAPGSVMVCLGLGTTADDLAAELLVRILRDQKVDARHFSVGDGGPPPGASTDGVAIVYLVSAFPGAERERSGTVAARVRELLPGASLLNVFLPGVSAQPAAIPPDGNADDTVTSFAQALQICLEHERERAKN
jgi:predicted PurR-regulated permease PerM